MLLALRLVEKSFSEPYTHILCSRYLLIIFTIEELVCLLRITTNGILENKLLLGGKHTEMFCCPGISRLTFDLCLLPGGRSCDRVFGIDPYASANALVNYNFNINEKANLTEPEHLVMENQSNSKESITTPQMLYKMCLLEGIGFLLKM